MALAFRNVDVSPDDPVVEWPLEAIQTALERGGLSHWRRLASTIRAQPWGPVARGSRGSSDLQPTLRGCPRGGTRDRRNACGSRERRARIGGERGEATDRGLGPLPSRVRLSDRHLPIPPVDLRKRKSHALCRFDREDASNRRLERKGGRRAAPLLKLRSIG